METIVATVISGSLLTVPSAINVISSSASTIYALLDSISKSGSTYVEDVVEFITDSDIKIKLKTYTSLLSEIKVPESRTIVLCINNIYDAIKNIEKELKIINTNKRYNESLYVAKGWRSYSFKTSIDKIKILINLLESRILAFRNTCDIISFLGLKENDKNHMNNDDIENELLLESMIIVTNIDIQNAEII